MATSLSTLEKMFLGFNFVLGAGVVGCVFATRDPAENPLNIASLVLVAIGTVGVSALGWLLSKRTAAAVAASNAEAKSAAAAAAMARKQAGELQRLMAWRELDENSAKVLLHQLSKVPREQRIQVWIQFVDNDPEVFNLQAQLRQVFQVAGMDPQYYSGWERAVGLQVSNCNTPTGRAVVEALSLIGLGPQPLQGDIDRAPGPGTVQILVGSKPPPDFRKLLRL